MHYFILIVIRVAVKKQLDELFFQSGKFYSFLRPQINVAHSKNNITFSVESRTENVNPLIMLRKT